MHTKFEYFSCSWCTFSVAWLSPLPQSSTLLLPQSKLCAHMCTLSIVLQNQQIAHVFSVSTHFTTILDILIRKHTACDLSVQIIFLSICVTVCTNSSFLFITNTSSVISCSIIPFKHLGCFCFFFFFSAYEIFKIISFTRYDIEYLQFQQSGIRDKTIASGLKSSWCELHGKLDLSEGL